MRKHYYKAPSKTPHSSKHNTGQVEGLYAPRAKKVVQPAVEPDRDVKAIDWFMAISAVVMMLTLAALA